MNIDNKIFALIVDNDLNVQLLINSKLILICILIVVFFTIYKIFSSIQTKSFTIDEAELGIGNLKFKLKPNITDMQIAYKIWIELSTRKIGIPIDLEHDVIVEIYNSWYTFFSVTRDLLKEIPINKYKDKNTGKIIQISIDVLNESLRPHLTKWQAKYRRWYDQESNKKSNLNLSPQEIQKKYKQYDAILKDLIKVNRTLINYREKMKELISL